MAIENQGLPKNPPPSAQQQQHTVALRIEACRAAVAGMQRLPQAGEQVGNQDVLESLAGFDTSTDALKKLKAAGVTNPVILAMVKA